MALKPCKECGKEISDKAKSCPNCGAKIEPKMSLGKFLLVILFGFLVYKCVSPSREVDESIGKAANLQEINNVDVVEKRKGVADSEYMTQCQKAIERQANHPSTVKHHRFSTSVYHAPNGNVSVTAPFSAKNSYGLETERKARCIFPVKGEPEISIK